MCAVPVHSSRRYSCGHLLTLCVHGQDRKQYDAFQLVAHHALKDFEAAVTAFADVRVFTGLALEVLHDVAQSSAEFSVRERRSLARGPTCLTIVPCCHSSKPTPCCWNRIWSCSCAMCACSCSWGRWTMRLSWWPCLASHARCGLAHSVTTCQGTPALLRGSPIRTAPHLCACAPSVADFIHRMRDPVAALQEDFKPICEAVRLSLVVHELTPEQEGNVAPRAIPQITRVLVDLKLPLKSSFRVLKTGQESKFNPLNAPSTLGTCETDPVFQHLLFFDRVKTWVTFGFLVCPFNLSVPGAMDAVRMVLEDGFAVQVWEDEVRLIHPMFEHMFESLKTTSVLKVLKPKTLVLCVTRGVCVFCARVCAGACVCACLAVAVCSPGV